MSSATRSFTRSLFAGDIHDDLIFPYPDSLEQRDPEEAAVVTRIIRELNALVGDLIRPDQFDEEETIPEPVIEAFARLGLLGISATPTPGIGTCRSRGSASVESIFVFGSIRTRMSVSECPF